MKDAKLKPCPFCGKDPEIIKLENYGKDDWYVQCNNRYCVEQKHLYSSKNAAIKSWNRRACNGEITATIIQ